MPTTKKPWENRSLSIIPAFLGPKSMAQNAEYVASARSVLARSTASVRPIKDAAKRMAVVRDAAILLAISGDVPGAEALADTIPPAVPGPGAPQKLIALRAIATVKARLRDIAGEAESLAKAGKIGEARKMVGGGSDALAKIAVVQARNGDLEGALATVGAIRGSDEQRQDWNKAEALGKVAAAVATSRSPQGVARILAAVRSIAARAENGAWVLAFFARARAEGGDPSGASEVATSISDMEARMFALSRVVIAQVKAEDLTGAQRTAAGMGQGEYAVLSWLSIANRQVASGETKEANNALARAATLLSSVHEQGPGAGEQLFGFQKTIVSLRAKLGDVDGVREILDRIRKETSADGLVYIVGDAFPEAVVALAKSGKPDAAEKLIDFMPRREVRSESWAALSRHYAARHETERATRSLAEARKWAGQASGENLPLALLEAGDVAGAEMFLTGNPSGDKTEREIRLALLEDLLRSLGRTAAMESRVGATPPWMDRLTNPVWKAQILLGFATGLLERAGLVGEDGIRAFL